MERELRARARLAAQRARSRLRSKGCDWDTAGSTGSGQDAPFRTDADALRWLRAACASRMAVDQEAADQLAVLVRRIREVQREGMRALSVNPLGSELVVGVRNHFVVYQYGVFEQAPVIEHFQSTTKALRALEAESEALAHRYRLPVGKATAAILTDVLPETRGRSLVDDRLDDLLKDVLREMKEQGTPIPGAGHPGRDSGVKTFWEEAKGRFNKAVDTVAELRQRRAGDWTTTRSRYKSLCERDPEFKKEIGDSGGEQADA